MCSTLSDFHFSDFFRIQTKVEARQIDCERRVFFFGVATFLFVLQRAPVFSFCFCCLRGAEDLTHDVLDEGLAVSLVSLVVGAAVLDSVEDGLSVVEARLCRVLPLGGQRGDLRALGDGRPRVHDVLVGRAVAMRAGAGVVLVMMAVLGLRVRAGDVVAMRLRLGLLLRRRDVLRLAELERVDVLVRVLEEDQDVVLGQLRHSDFGHGHFFFFCVGC
jgi:hypothetical protein